jgi:predicted transcriptional regulator YdeE
MNKIAIKEITLMGLSLKKKTSNANGQSNIDCGNLWQKFETEDYANKITGRLNDEVLAVYHDYEGDYTKPFSYFIGCRVKPGEPIPQGLDT